METYVNIAKASEIDNKQKWNKHYGDIHSLHSFKHSFMVYLNNENTKVNVQHKSTEMYCVCPKWYPIPYIVSITFDQSTRTTIGDRMPFGTQSV